VFGPRMRATAASLGIDEGATGKPYMTFGFDQAMVSAMLCMETYIDGLALSLAFCQPRH
jgi:hypothetical protein